MVSKSNFEKWSLKETSKYVVKPIKLDHKYSRGVLGLITGSNKYPGAAVLTSSAAVKTGIGMVRFQPINESWSWQPVRFVEGLVLSASPEVVPSIDRVTAWLLGSGIADRGNGFENWLRHRDLRKANSQSVPVILDAGALYLTGTFKSPTLITPHFDELAKLLSNRGIKVTSTMIAANPKKWVIESVNRLGVSVLLKGSTTYLSNGSRVIEMPQATSWLATAGSGDVLAGIIGALVATNSAAILKGEIEIMDIGASGAMIHALAAHAASSGGPISATAIIAKVPEIIKKILT